MTRRATFLQADVTRAMKAAIKAGLPPGSFQVEIQDGAIRVLPISANSPANPAEDAEKRMREAFGR